MRETGVESARAEDFWTTFEAETGEKVVAKTMGQCFTAPGDRGDWGLLVLTERSLRFRKVPSENWLLSLVKASSPPPSRGAAEDIVIPLPAMRKVIRPKRSLMDRLFGTPFSTFTVEYLGGDTSIQIRFSVDPKDSILTLLERDLVRT
jgi:hypothetical protein